MIKLCFTFLFILISIQITHGDVDCGEAFECVDQVINTDSLSAYGYYSNSGAKSNITVSQDAMCYGSFSCFNVLNISGGTILCYGSDSCINTSLYFSGFEADIGCYGLNACSNSVIDALGNDVFCYGDNGCKNSTIKHAVDVFGYGSYSLNNATIQTDNTNQQISIYLTGYNAGYNLKIICLQKDTCNIQCQGNACDSTIFDCKGKDNCNIYKISDWYLNSFTYNNTVEESNIDNNICNSTKFKIDNEYENYNSTMINQLTNYTNVCCRGAYSCDESYVHNKTVISVNNLLCSSAFGCSQIDIDNIFNSIYCTGAGSCWSMNFTTHNIYCMGWYSCNSLNVTAKNIFLTGWISGHNMIVHGAENVYRFNNDILNQTIISNGNLNVYSLNDLVSGSYIQIICNNNDNCIIKCATTSSCIDTQVFCYGNCMLYCKLRNPPPNNQYVCPNVTKINGGTVTYHYISQKTN